MIDTAAVAECNRRLAQAGGSAVDAAALRRNLVVDGVNLMSVGRSWLRIGTVQLEIVGTCPPCGYLSRLLGEDMRQALYRIGGVRARIHSDGRLQVGDPIALEAMPGRAW